MEDEIAAFPAAALQHLFLSTEKKQEAATKASCRTMNSHSHQNQGKSDR